MKETKQATAKPVAKAVAEAKKEATPEVKAVVQTADSNVMDKNIKAEIAKEPINKEEVKTASTQKAPVAKKAPSTKKAAAAKKAPAAKKASQTKTIVKESICIEFAGKSYTQADLVKIAKDVWKYDLKQKAAELSDLELYVKPEENKVYYVMNKTETGDFDI